MDIYLDQKVNSMMVAVVFSQSSRKRHTVRHLTNM
jgi:hypothetical protein